MADEYEEKLNLKDAIILEVRFFWQTAELTLN